MIMLTLFVFLCTTVISEVFSVVPIQLPMRIQDGNWLIKAKLVDKDDAFQINIVEYIKSANGTIRGRIDFKIDDGDGQSIFYTNKEQYNRLLYDDHSCSLFKYNTHNGWGSHLSTLSGKEFLNHLLFIGPSVVFRITEYANVWELVKDEVIRGIKEHAAKVALDPNLHVWFYFKDENHETGIKKPNQVMFYGFDPNSWRYKWTKKHWFDIYANTRVERNFDTIVTPNPTLYCQRSDIDSLGLPHEPFPKITENSIRFISKTKSFNAGPSKREDVYADEKYQILNIKSLTNADNNEIITTETIYDYQLGIEYEFTEDGKCLVSPMKLSAPGLVQDSSLGYGVFKLDLNRLLDFDLNYRYFGPTLFEERNEIGTHAWQLSEEKAKVEQITYPYVVTTQYFNKFTNISSGYTLVGTKINAYDIKSSSFNVQNCYPDPESRRIIAMYFTCKDIPCDYFEQNYKQLQNKVKESLNNTGTIAATRIASIAPIFKSDEMIIYITILDFPKIKNAFKMRNIKLAEKTLATSSKVLVDGYEEDCLMQNSYKYEPFEAIAFCKTVDGYLCQRIDGEKVKLIEDNVNGLSCSVFMTPLKNIYRYSQELPLENIHERLDHIKISFTLLQDNKMFTFTPYHVADATKVNDNEHDSLFDSIIRNTKLVEDKMKTISVIDATDSSSCYRKCANSVENKCNSFSFCVYNDRVECLVSTIENIASETISPDASCITYLLDNLQKFKKIPSKRFTDVRKSVSFDSSLGKCASFCYNSDSCKSFQFCSGSCSMAGQYTDAASDYSEDCDIYIPKVLGKFEVTGTLIVENAFHTEMNLNADQCAALCHDWNDKEVTCQSFNYCPAHAKKLSICQLSKYYPSHDADVKLVHSDTCQNYERSKQSLMNQQENKPITRSNHIATIFGSILLFVVAGFILGVFAVIVFKKFHPVKKNDPSESYDHLTSSWNQPLNNEN